MAFPSTGQGSWPGEPFLAIIDLAGALEGLPTIHIQKALAVEGQALVVNGSRALSKPEAMVSAGPVGAS